MTLTKAMEAVLTAWRGTERLLAETPPGSPAYETIRSVAIELRDLYRRLASAGQPSPSLLRSTQRKISRARASLDSVRGSNPPDTAALSDGQ